MLESVSDEGDVLASVRVGVSPERRHSREQYVREDTHRPDVRLRVRRLVVYYFGSWKCVLNIIYYKPIPLNKAYIKVS